MEIIDLEKRLSKFKFDRFLLASQGKLNKEFRRYIRKKHEHRNGLWRLQKAGNLEDIVKRSKIRRLKFPGDERKNQVEVIFEEVTAEYLLNQFKNRFR